MLWLTDPENKSFNHCLLLCTESQNCLVKYSKRSVLTVKNISMTACVGNYFRLASLPLLRKITECGNYCKASPDLEHFLPVTSACSGQCFSLRLHFAAWLCTVPLPDRHQSLGRLHQDHSLHKQVHDWPLAQTGLHNPNTCPKGNRSLCCASLKVNLSSPCLSTVHWHTPAKPRKH